MPNNQTTLFPQSLDDDLLERLSGFVTLRNKDVLHHEDGGQMIDRVNPAIGCKRSSMPEAADAER